MLAGLEGWWVGGVGSGAGALQWQTLTPMTACSLALPTCTAYLPAYRRWFHGTCAKVGQQEVDAMGEVEWNCQGCKAYRRQQERAAARSQR